jgi:hypothetical protein
VSSGGPSLVSAGTGGKRAKLASRKVRVNAA